MGVCEMKINKEKESKLTQEKLKSMLHYDPDSGVFTWKVRTSSRANIGDMAGCIRRCGHMAIGLHGGLYFSHRLAFLYMTGEFPNGEVDHINHVRNDNSFANLRVVNMEDNQKNKTIQKNNKSGATGISFDKANSKWRARIFVNKRNVHLGFFSNIEDAIAARHYANIKYNYHVNHGVEFNKPTHRGA